MKQLSMGSAPKPLKFEHFPTIQQAIVWRNWGIVPLERIAEVLATSVENIVKMGNSMGLKQEPSVEKEWLKRGYITIIRANWHLLNYNQLLKLLGWSEEELAYTLKEDDFLWHKLGNAKPDAKTISYSELSYCEQIATAKLKQVIQTEFSRNIENDVISSNDATPSDNACIEQPFDFLKEFYLPSKPDRIEYNDNAKENEIKLDSCWSLVNACSGDAATNDSVDAPVNSFINKFIDNHFNVFGIHLNKATNPCTSSCVLHRSVLILIEPDDNKPAESHRIEIQRDLIKIIAVDQNGLLRGLQWIEKEMEHRKGPFLKIGNINRKTVFDFRMLYTYFGIYGDTFADATSDPYPDGLLKKLSNIGVNGIWLQGILYKLIPFPWEPELSEGWEMRLEALKMLIKRAATFGIKVYLYLNEPRSMPLSFFEKYPELKGSIEGETAALCTSHPAVKEYLYNSVHKLFTEVNELGGVFTITMSENLTNCYSRIREEDIKCPRCMQRPAYEIVAEVNTIIAKAARSAKPDAKVISWTWAWNPEWSQKVIELLPDYVSLMCPSEEALKTNVAGVVSKVIDYSISNPGPGELSSMRWEKAAERGMGTIAKVQFNNTWECSAVPYIPALNLVKQHIEGLTAKGINGLMLSWTLGGYPSINLELASQYFWETQTSASDTQIAASGEINIKREGLAELAIRKFGEKAAAYVVSAWEYFSSAFREFPFDLGVVYTAPQNSGPKNLLYDTPTGYSATMVGFPYDNLKTWRSVYPEDIFEKQFEKLSKGWCEGIQVLKKAEVLIDKNNIKAFNELMNISETLYCHFQSTYLQIVFVRARDAQNFDGMLQVVKEEAEIAKKMYTIMCKDSKMGYEASNHYYYTRQDLMEKVLNCRFIEDKLRSRG